eukprot:15352274-Ditylum_brightwellii.AAC.1
MGLKQQLLSTYGSLPMSWRGKKQLVLQAVVRGAKWSAYSISKTIGAQVRRVWGSREDIINAQSRSGGYHNPLLKASPPLNIMRSPGMCTTSMMIPNLPDKKEIFAHEDLLVLLTHEGLQEGVQFFPSRELEVNLNVAPEPVPLPSPQEVASVNGSWGHDKACIPEERYSSHHVNSARISSVRMATL